MSLLFILSSSIVSTGINCQSGSSVQENFICEEGGIVRGDTTQNIIYLVFTGGDYSEGGLKIRETLLNHSIKAHFFFTGDFYRNEHHSDLIRTLKSDGHYLGAHSDKHLLYAAWNNRDSTLVTRDEFVSDLNDNYREMTKFSISRRDAPLFLPPYEWYNRTISDWAGEMGLTLINFTPGTTSNADYTTPDMSNYIDSETIKRNIFNYEKRSRHGLNGFFLLMHIGTHPTRTDKLYDHLDEILRELKHRGYRFDLFSKSYEHKP
ncbi:polysaccharide deacetylase family protein [candidate division KSB1 bacterium]|nr:polysaccharide deacetylase family protein [candidate division KSB1 bacterium]